MAARLIPVLLTGAVVLLLAARWVAGSGGEGAGGGDRLRDSRPAGAMASPLADASAPPETSGSPAGGTAPPSARFRERVLRELRALEGEGPRPEVMASPGPGAVPPRLASRSEPQPQSREPRAGSPPPGRSRGAAAGLDPEDLARVDWDYLGDVFAGRVSGIPDERKAGISLQQMDALGAIPAIEALREQGRYEVLRDLGFENETVPWPVCLRTGTCRRDANSSP